MVFALLLSVIILSERPDILTLTGAAIIVASGVYTFVRENVLNKSK
jgi:drug/metabolite transporter (DMT)-like permease